MLIYANKLFSHPARSTSTKQYHHFVLDHGNIFLHKLATNHVDKKNPGPQTDFIFVYFQHRSGTNTGLWESLF